MNSLSLFVADIILKMLFLQSHKFVNCAIMRKHRIVIFGHVHSYILYEHLYKYYPRHFIYWEYNAHSII